MAFGQERTQKIKEVPCDIGPGVSSATRERLAVAVAAPTKD
jgi:hypothetical protein